MTIDTVAIIDSERVTAKLTGARGRRNGEAKGQDGSFFSTTGIFKMV